MMIKKIVCFVLLLCFQIVLGQHPDTMKTVLQSKLPDSVKLKAALGLSKYYTRIDLDSAKHYIAIAEQIAPAFKNPNNTPRIRLQKAGVLLLEQDFANAESLLYKNLETPSLALDVLAMTYQNLGNIHVFRKENERAINHYLEALKLFERRNDSIGVAKVYSNIGIIHSRLKNFTEAISYFEKARLYAEIDEVVNLQVLANLAGIYHDQNNFEKSIRIGNEALSLAKTINSPMYLGSVYSNLCNSYLGAKQYDRAITSGIMGIEIKQRLGQNSDILFNNLGHAYLKQGKYQKAITYLKKVSPQAPSSLRSLLYNNLGEAYGKLNDYQTAWRYAQMHTKINDSLNAVLFQESDSITAIVRAYEREKNAQTLDLLNTKNALNLSKIEAQRGTIWIIGLLSTLLLTIGFFIYTNQRNKQRFKMAISQHRLLRTQLNPHFLFNALSAVQAHIYLNKKEESATYLSNFSKLMRLVLESSDRDFISVEDDARMLDEYIQLQQLVVKNKFDYSLSISEDLNPEIIDIPSVMTQPFVENAIVHALKDVPNGKLEIRYSSDGKNLTVVISDNGEGIKSDLQNTNKMHRSMSTDILAERMENLRLTHNYDCSLSTETSKSGTTIKLSFPIHHSKL